MLLKMWLRVNFRPMHWLSC